MIIVKMIGGLGNQLFQYALGRRLSLRLGVELKLDVTGFRYYKLHKFALHHFNIHATLATDREVSAYHAEAPIPLTGRLLIVGSRASRALRGLEQASAPLGRRLHDGVHRRYVAEPAMSFNPAVLETGDNTYLDGFWQCEQYFKEIEAALRQELTVKTPLNPGNLEMAARTGGDSSVSVHVRRADYVTNATTLKVHGVCTAAYYARCAQIIRQRVGNPTFFVFSDDTAWARSNLDLGGPTHVVTLNDADRNYADLWLMSLCRHHVIANSSFSWWSAWLDARPDKTVLAPARWFATPQRDENNVVPSEWQRVANDAGQ